MIYFNKEKFQQITNILSLPEHIKEAGDLVSISNAIICVRLYGMEAYANELDAKLRKDYPIIEEMLTIADNMPKAKISGKNERTFNVDPPIVQRLLQDYYGICTKMLLKEKLIHSIEEFIDYVEEN